MSDYARELMHLHDSAAETGEDYSMVMRSRFVIDTGSFDCARRHLSAGLRSG